MGSVGYSGTAIGAIVLTTLTSLLIALKIGAAGRQVVNGLILIVLLSLYGRQRRLGRDCTTGRKETDVNAPLGVGIVGSGFIGNFHVTSWTGVRGADIVAVQSRNAQTAAAWPNARGCSASAIPRPRNPGGAGP